LKRNRQAVFPGQVMVFFALAIVVLTGFVAMGVDVGYALSQRRELQNSADAAALAVADAILAGTTNTTTLTNTANTYIAANGFDNADLSLSIDSKSNPETITVDVTSNVQKFFLGAVYKGPWSIKAHAVASVNPILADYALLALDQSGNPVYVNGSNNSIKIVGGSAMSDGGMFCNGTGSITATDSMNTHTSFTTNGGCKFSGTGGTNTGSSIVDDPLKNVPPPPKPSTPSTGSSVACTVVAGNTTCLPGKNTGSILANGSNYTITFSKGDHQLINQSVIANGTNNTVIFYPGTYYFKNTTFTLNGGTNTAVFMPGAYTFYMDGGSFTFNGQSNGFDTSNVNVEFYFHNTSVTFNGAANTVIPPGIYYFDGSNPVVNGGQTVSGSDVLFYFDNGSYLTTNGTTAYNFTASPTSLYSGGQAGMLIYAARGNTGTFLWNGASGDYLGGVVYIPSGTVQLNGTQTGTWAEGQMIVDKLTSNGSNTNITIKYKKYIDMSTPVVYLIQ